MRKTNNKNNNNTINQQIGGGDANPRHDIITRKSVHNNFVEKTIPIQYNTNIGDCHQILQLEKDEIYNSILEELETRR